MKPDDINARDEFDMAIGEKLGLATSAKYFESDPEIVTPTLDRYEDDEEHQTGMPEVDDITPETIDNYIGAKIIISHDDTLAQGGVRRRKRDMEENTIGGANSNTILDIQNYEWNLRMGERALTLQMLLQKVCMLSVMWRGRHTSCLDQYWITRHMGMPYQWRIKMWLYVGEFRNPKPQSFGTCVSNGRMGQQHGRGYHNSRNITPFRLQSNHFHKRSAMILNSIGR